MRKQILFGLITVMAILVLAGSVSGVVLGMPRQTVRTDSGFYRQMEEVYVEQVNRLLEEEGLPSAGVTLTYERDRDGNRHYTVLVHHHRLEGYDTQTRNLLAKQMEAVFFTAEDCSITAELVWQL